MPLKAATAGGIYRGTTAGGKATPMGMPETERSSMRNSGKQSIFDYPRTPW
jgi:hypothetical protein